MKDIIEVRKIMVDFIQKIYPMPDHIATHIASQFEPIQFFKNDYLLKSGEVCDQCVFVRSGFARAYTLDLDGNDITTGFFGNNAIVFEVSSFFKRTPSTENIQFLSDSIGLKASHEDFQKMFHTIPEYREFGRTMLINGFVALKERMLSMINCTAETRYEKMLKARPDIFQNASLKHIATYLGITDTSLSRIRKELSSH